MAFDDNKTKDGWHPLQHGNTLSQFPRSEHQLCAEALTWPSLQTAWVARPRHRTDDDCVTTQAMRPPQSQATTQTSSPPPPGASSPGPAPSSSTSKLQSPLPPPWGLRRASVASNLESPLATLLAILAAEIVVLFQPPEVHDSDSPASFPGWTQYTKYYLWILLSSVCINGGRRSRQMREKGQKEEEDQQLQGQINKKIDFSVKLGSDLTSWAPNF